MRRLYLIRHGEPAFPNGQRVCLGQMDLPLSTLGKLQACLAGWALREKSISQVFSSCRSRSRETAAFISPDYMVLDGLEEISTGEWDGLCFDEIKRRWPVLYEQRGADPLLPMPGGEDMASAQRRFAAAVDTALHSTKGDIALISHAQVIDLFLASVMGVSFEEVRRHRLGYGTGVCLCWFGGDVYTEESRVIPRPALNRELCLALLDAAGLPVHVKAHCQAVSEEALRIADALPIALDRQLLEHAALLHDIARLQPKHPQTGAAWLRALGYGEVADVVELHHDHDGERLDEAAVLFMADKCVKEAGPVSLEERFAKSAQRCTDDASKAAHHRRYQAAMAIQEKINGLCQKEVVL